MTHMILYEMCEEKQLTVMLGEAACKYSLGRHGDIYGKINDLVNTVSL